MDRKYKDMNIEQKIIEVKKALQEREIKASGYNKKHDYHFLELKDILRPIIEEESRVGLNDSINLDHIEKIATLTITDGKEIKTYTVPLVYAKLPLNTDIQNMGATITYYRRYLLSLAFGLYEKDLVNIDEPERETEPLVKADEIIKDVTTADDYINKIRQENNISLAELKKMVINKFNKTSWNELTPDEFDILVGMIEVRNDEN